MLPIVLAVLSFGFAAHAATETNKADGAKLPLPRTIEWQSRSGSSIAYDMVRTFLTEEEFQSEVSTLFSKFKDWESDTHGDIDRYLNDRLVIVGLSAAGGDQESIQKGILWLAYYRAFRQGDPSMVRKFLEEHQGSLSRLLKDFTWEKASDYVKNKRWREDIEERKRKERGETVAQAEAKPQPKAVAKIEKPAPAVKVAEAPKVVAQPAPAVKVAEAPKPVSVVKPAPKPDTRELAMASFRAPLPAEAAFASPEPPAKLYYDIPLTFDWNDHTAPAPDEIPLTDEWPLP
ncbi:MAG: hypothetical protein L6R28_23620 [Planctomycetes bacterium]|nr:hypothetical protein [Planctomycetota bacterium]